MSNAGDIVGLTVGVYVVDKVLNKGRLFKGSKRKSKRRNASRSLII